MGLIGAAVVGLVLVGFFNWRRGVVAALVMLIFEGAIRKWVFPQGSQWVYFAKDFLLLGSYVGYFFGKGHRQPAQFDAGLNLILITSVVWTFFESLNPGTGSLVAGLFGWRAYVYYLPLCFMVPSLFRTNTDFERFLRFYLALALPICALGMAQFQSSSDSPLNTYAAGVGSPAETGTIAVFGDDQFVRVTGTFSYVSGFGAYLIFTLALILPTLISTRNKLWRAIFAGALIMVTGCIVMTGSRAPALGGALILAGFLVLTLLTGTSKERTYWWVYLLTSAVGIVATLFFFEKAVNALQQRTEGSLAEGQNRLVAAVREPWDYLAFAGIFGYGDGITQPAVGALRTALHLAAPASEYASPTDAENSRVMMELGVPGFFLWYGLRVGIVIVLWRTRERLQSAFLRQVALGGFLVLLYQLFTVTMFNPTSNIYHWFIAGFIFLLPRLDAQREARSKPALSPIGTHPVWLRKPLSQPNGEIDVLQAARRQRIASFHFYKNASGRGMSRGFKAMSRKFKAWKRRSKPKDR
jgi:hypothetical protein